MLDKLKQHSWKVLAALGGFYVIYILFIMNLGTRTFAQHLIRIATTPEAQDMASEVFDTLGGAVGAVTSRVRGAISGYQDVGDD
jgi:hypothetical protein